VRCRFLPFMSEKRPSTRFAPSPTGFLHNRGGARHRAVQTGFTAARPAGGRMLLRIEDTDREPLDQGRAIDRESSTGPDLARQSNGTADVIYQFRPGRRPANPPARIAEQLLAGRPGPTAATPPQQEARTRWREEGPRSEGPAPKLYDGRWARTPSDPRRTRRQASSPVIPAQGHPLTGETGDRGRGFKAASSGRTRTLDDLVLLALRDGARPTLYASRSWSTTHEHGASRTSSAATTTLTKPARGKSQIYKRARLVGAGDGRHIPLIPRTGTARSFSKRHGRALRGSTPTAPWGYLPAAFAQLYLVRPRLEPRRPGDLLDRGDGRGHSISPIIGPVRRRRVRFRQARKASNGPLHPPIKRRRRGSSTRIRWPACRISPTAPRSLRRSSRRNFKAQLAAAMPGLKEGAREETSSNSVEKRSLFLYSDADRPIALDDQGKKSAAQFPEACVILGRTDDGFGWGRAVGPRQPDREWPCGAFAERKEGQARRAVAQPLACPPLTGRPTLAGDFRRAPGARKAREASPRLADQARHGSLTIRALRCGLWRCDALLSLFWPALARPQGSGL